jgi:phosphatidate cytidylyltransferase
VLALAALLFAGSSHELRTSAVLGLGLAWWGVAALWVIDYQRGRRRGILLGRPLLAGAIGWLVLLPSWLAVVALHGEPARGPALVLILLCVIWGADTGAYFAGRRLGKHKLASRVSPGKTWEGALGGLVTVLAVGPIGGAWIGLGGGDLGWFVVLCALTVPVSIVGDLTESLFKREAGVKDSGSSIPGHGGVLDRIDSLTAAAPFFAIGWSLMGALA